MMNESPRLSAILSLMMRAGCDVKCPSVQSFTTTHGRDVPNGTFSSGMTLGRVNGALGYTVYGIPGSEEQAIDIVLGLCKS